MIIENEFELMCKELGELLLENLDLLQLCYGMKIFTKDGSEFRLTTNGGPNNLGWICTGNFYAEEYIVEFESVKEFSVDLDDWATQGVLRGLLSLFKESQMIDVSEHSVLVSTIDPSEEYDSDDEEHVDNWHLFEYDNYGMALAAALIYAI